MLWIYRTTTSITTILLSESLDREQNHRDLRQSGGLLLLPSSLPLACIFVQLIDVRNRTQSPNLSLERNVGPER
jgi:hypothetical protein